MDKKDKIVQNLEEERERADIEDSAMSAEQKVKIKGASKQIDYSLQTRENCPTGILSLCESEFSRCRVCYNFRL